MDDATRKAIENVVGKIDVGSRLSGEAIDKDTALMVAFLQDALAREDKPTPGGLVNTQDYRDAPYGNGPLAAEWQDKPHRLLFDLCRDIDIFQTRCLRGRKAAAPLKPAPGAVSRRVAARVSAAEKPRSH